MVRARDWKSRRWRVETFTSYQKADNLPKKKLRLRWYKPVERGGVAIRNSSAIELYSGIVGMEDKADLESAA